MHPPALRFAEASRAFFPDLLRFLDSASRSPSPLRHRHFAYDLLLLLMMLVVVMVVVH